MQAVAGFTGSPEAQFSLRTRAVQWEIATDLGLWEGWWFPSVSNQSHSIPTSLITYKGEFGVLLWAAHLGDNHVHLSIQQAAAVRRESLSLMASSLGPCCQAFQDWSASEKSLLINDRKKKNLIGSQLSVL